jgi:hypothetical protein
MKFPIKEPLPDYTREVFGSRIMATDADSPLAPDLCRFLLSMSGMPIHLAVKPAVQGADKLTRSGLFVQVEC